MALFHRNRLPEEQRLRRFVQTKLTRSDHEALKLVAAEQQKSVAEIVRGMIRQLLQLRTLSTIETED